MRNMTSGSIYRHLLAYAIPLIFGNPESIPFEPFYNTIKAGVSPNFLVPFMGGELVVSKHAVICLVITVVILAVLFLLLKSQIPCDCSQSNSYNL